MSKADKAIQKEQKHLVHAKQLLVPRGWTDTQIESVVHSLPFKDLFKILSWGYQTRTYNEKSLQHDTKDVIKLFYSALEQKNYDELRLIIRAPLQHFNLLHLPTFSSGNDNILLHPLQFALLRQLETLPFLMSEAQKQGHTPLAIRESLKAPSDAYFRTLSTKTDMSEAFVKSIVFALITNPAHVERQLIIFGGILEDHELKALLPSAKLLKDCVDPLNTTDLSALYALITTYEDGFLLYASMKTFIAQETTDLAGKWDLTFFSNNKSSLFHSLDMSPETFFKAFSTLEFNDTSAEHGVELINHIVDKIFNDSDNVFHKQLSDAFKSKRLLPLQEAGTISRLKDFLIDQRSSAQVLSFH